MSIPYRQPSEQDDSHPLGFFIALRYAALPVIAFWSAVIYLVF